MKFRTDRNKLPVRVTNIDRHDIYKGTDSHLAQISIGKLRMRLEQIYLDVEKHSVRKGYTL